MQQRTIADIYAANDRVREELKETIAGLTDEQASLLPEGEKWTIAQILEHISIVGDGMGRVCNKLLRKAESAGTRSQEGVRLSEGFIKGSSELAAAKIEAPETVRPTGEVPVEQSLAKLDDNHSRLEELRPLFESVDSETYKFPHPFLGDMSAAEWLTMIGEHEARHLNQIKKRLEL
jgi:hypothetical protein